MDEKPKCIIVTGMPGAGKTTLAKQMAAGLRMPLISRDAIKEGYVNSFGIQHDQLPPQTNGLISNFFFEMVYQYLRGKVSIVIEAAFQHHIWEPRMAQIEQLSKPFMLICSIDRLVAAERRLQRRLNNPLREFYHGDKLVSPDKNLGEPLAPSQYAMPHFDVPTVKVLTESGYSPSIEEIERRIRSAYAP